MCAGVSGDTRANRIGESTNVCEPIGLGKGAKYSHVEWESILFALAFVSLNTLTRSFGVVSGGRFVLQRNTREPSALRA